MARYVEPEDDTMRYMDGRLRRAFAAYDRWVRRTAAAYDRWIRRVVRRRGA